MKVWDNEWISKELKISSLFQSWVSFVFYKVYFAFCCFISKITLRIKQLRMELTLFSLNRKFITHCPGMANDGVNRYPKSAIFRIYFRNVRFQVIKWNIQNIRTPINRWTIFINRSQAHRRRSIPFGAAMSEVMERDISSSNKNRIRLRLY